MPGSGILTRSRPCRPMISPWVMKRRRFSRTLPRTIALKRWWSWSMVRNDIKDYYAPRGGGLLTSPLRAAALRGEAAPAGAGEGLIVNATALAPAQTLTRRWRADLSL